MQAGGPTRTLFRLYGIGGGGELPGAAITRVVDAGDADDGVWLRADPVWMDVGTQLVLKGWGDLGLSREEVDELGASLREYFEPAGLSFSAPYPSRWYLRLAEDEALETVPLDELAGRDCSDHLPAGPAAAAWRRLTGEVQMILHNHPVNRHRRSQGRPPVNSLWFWGKGKLPGHAPSGFSRVIGSDAVAKGLAALPGGTREDAGMLLIADGSASDEAVWREWHASGVASRRVLVPDARREFRLSLRDRFRFWRSRRSLEALLAPRPEARP